MAFEGGRWHLEVSDGSSDVADIVIAATGVLHHPRYPDIDGLDRFHGALFHSARWDHSVPLEGKRIGVVGTGSTAVQITGRPRRRGRGLPPFQRTAPWIMPAPNAPIPDDERDCTAPTRSPCGPSGPSWPACSRGASRTR